MINLKSLVSRNIVRNNRFEEIENFSEAAESSEKYILHHRLETHHEDGTPRVKHLTMRTLIELDKYYDRPPEELIFLPRKEHYKLHFEGENNPIRKMTNEQFKNVIDNMLSKQKEEYIYCWELDETKRSCEWVKKGFEHVCRCAEGFEMTCRGLHFSYVDRHKVSISDNRLLESSRLKKEKYEKNVIELKTGVIESKSFWARIGYTHVYDLDSIGQIIYTKNRSFKLIDSYDPLHSKDDFDPTRTQEKSNLEENPL